MSDRYQDLAREAMDKVDEFGDARVSGVADVEGLRAAVRREARRRKVKIITRGYQDRNFVIVVADQPSVLAQAWSAATLPVRMEHMHRPSGIPIASPSYVDAGEVENG